MVVELRPTDGQLGTLSALFPIRGFRAEVFDPAHQPIAAQVELTQVLQTIAVVRFTPPPVPWVYLQLEAEGYEPQKLLVKLPSGRKSPENRIDLGAVSLRHSRSLVFGAVVLNETSDGDYLLDTTVRNTSGSRREVTALALAGIWGYASTNPPPPATFSIEGEIVAVRDTIVRAGVVSTTERGAAKLRASGKMVVLRDDSGRESPSSLLLQINVQQTLAAGDEWKIRFKIPSQIKLAGSTATRVMHLDSHQLGLLAYVAGGANAVTTSESGGWTLPHLSVHVVSPGGGGVK